MEEQKITTRSHVVSADIEAVRAVTRATGFFHEPEVDIAVELVEERLAKGVKSGYYFFFAESGGKLAGYTTYGPIGCTASSFDLFWIVVHPAFQGRHIGKMLLALSEQEIRAMGGKRVYIETSSRELYGSTQGFYLKNGYVLEATIKDFYDEEDSKLIYVKVL